MKWFASTILCAAIVCAANTSANAALLYSQGFETDTSGWFDGGGFGSITHVASNTNGISSASGGFHAIVNEIGSGPFTRFDGYRDTFPGPYAARLDIYLDTNMDLGEGFDYSVASNGTDGFHQRDFIFHVTKDSSTSKLFVGGSNNSGASVREDLENLSNSFEVTSSGWYTFEHFFRNDNGVLAVDLNLYDANHSLLFTETRSAPADLIPSIVGGNRYGWFTNINSMSGIAIDNLQLATVPEPASIALFGIGGLALAGAFYRRRRSEQLPQQS